MDSVALQERLIAAFETFDIIDCHEHLKPERERVATPVDVFTLFSHYTQGDLGRAGMSAPQYQSLFNHDIPLSQRWATFEPFWERIRWTSYSRAALIAAKRFYGADDINARTYEAISQAIAKANTPGLYERVLKEACGIRTALTQCGRTDLGAPLLTPVMPLEYEMRTWEQLAHPPFEPQAEIRSLEDYIEAVRRYVLRVKAEGAVGLKIFVQPYGTPSREKATAVFNRLRDGSASTPPDEGALMRLREYVVDETVACGAQHDLVIAVHAGYWGDFRTLDPLHLIPLLERHPEARFDVYHLGYPWVRETLMLGKGFSNVWLNFCWTHIISQRCATDALDEAIDLLPTNKLLAFGGDYELPVEKVFGHLTMAREDVAQVLAKRVAGGRMSEEQAVEMARQWFWDNPKALYRLDSL